MGVVYRARDTRLNRSVALKILPGEFASDEASQIRFHREARAASALNHPNIVTIHEIGQTDGVHFIAQELVEGETLRQRLRRGRLPVNEALDIALQAGSALAAAHAAGVVHRDIKPDNIMLRPDGLVKVVDFGLAKVTSGSRPLDPNAATVADLHTTPGLVMGTVRYMSPEQAGGLPVDHRSDIFSLGLVLYEMLGGQPPFDGFAAGAAPTDDIERVVTKMLRKSPDERYQSVSDLLVDLRSSRAGTAVNATPARRWPLAFAAAGLLVALTIGVYAVRNMNRPAPAGGTVKLLLADFANSTGEAVFDDRTLRQALAIQLQQTPFLHLFSDQALRGALMMMTRSADERVTREIALELAQRQGLDAVVAGSIAALGRNYVITLEAVSTTSGDSLASVQTEAQGQEQVLDGLGRAAREMRGKLGESLSTLQRFNAPIHQATSASLEALKAYSAAQQQMVLENGRAALPLYRRAIELDPNFVAAYDGGAWASAMSGTPGSGALAGEGYRRRDSATELEKLSMAATYHHFTTGNRDEEDKLLAVASKLYPNEWGFWAGLALNHTAAGRYEEAIKASQEVRRVSPGIAQGYRFLAPALMRLGRFDEALKTIEEARSRQLDNVFNRQTAIQSAFALGHAEAQRDVLERIRQADSERQVTLWRGRIDAFEGRWRNARELFLQAQTADAALPQALFGFCRAEDGDRALAPARLTSASVAYAPLVATDGSLCGQVAVAETFADEMAKRFPQSTLTRDVSLPVLRAAIALKRDQPQQALDALRTTGIGGGAGFLPYYLRGQAHLRLKHGAEAAKEFSAILEHRGWGPMSVFYPLAHVGLARASAMAGDPSSSRRAYEAFFAAWKDADADLPVLIAAKQDYNRSP
jgi:tetratricopeptide (TPR) repeat protein